MAQKPEQRTCFSVSGSLTKSGKPCGFVIPEPLQFCQHHDPDRTRQKRIVSAGVRASREASVPEIKTNGFESIQDCLAVRSAVVSELTSKPRPNYRALDMILKACTGASADHGVKAAEKTNELLLALAGHGNGLLLLQRLREAKVRILPGKRNKVLDLTEVLQAKEPPADTQPVPSNEPEEA